MRVGSPECLVIDASTGEARMLVAHRIQISIVWLALIILPLQVLQPSWAGEPELVMHRTGANADDGTGWHRAVSTVGAFEVMMPAPFNDFTVSASDANVGAVATHTIGCVTRNGLKVLVTEMPFTAGMKRPGLDDLLKTWTDNPQQTVSDIERNATAAGQKLSYTVKGTGNVAAFFQYVLTPAALYTSIIEFQEAHRAEAQTIRDKVFSSLRIGRAP
jgi:hypothetical protein